MKVKSISLYNIAKYSTVTINLDERVNYLIGPNGAGKSTLGLTALQFVMQGIAEKSSNGTQPLIGERFRFIGPLAKTGFGDVVLFDEKKGFEVRVTRKLTKSGTELSFTGPAEMELNQEWLNDLFNAFLINPKKFLELSPKQQTQHLGLDTTKWDFQIQVYKEELADLNREIKSYGELVEPEKVDEVDFSSLSREKDELLEFNRQQDLKQEAIAKSNTLIDDLAALVLKQEEEIARLTEKLQQTKQSLELAINQHNELEEPAIKKSVDEIQSKIENATETNRKAALYKEYQKKKQKLEEIREQVVDMRTLIDEQNDQRLEYIKSFKFPFSKLSVDEEGGLLLNDKPIKPPYFSTGELIRIIPALIASQKPELKYVFLQDFNLLDEDKQKLVEKELTDMGFQLMIEYVGNKPVNDRHCIVLKDNVVIEETKSAVAE